MHWGAGEAPPAVNAPAVALPEAPLTAKDPEDPANEPPVPVPLLAGAAPPSAPPSAAGSPFGARLVVPQAASARPTHRAALPPTISLDLVPMALA